MSQRSGGGIVVVSLSSITSGVQAQEAKSVVEAAHIDHNHLSYSDTNMISGDGHSIYDNFVIKPEKNSFPTHSG